MNSHPTDPTPLARAFELACALHKDQMRKGTEIPYVSHLMAVSALVLEEGGSQGEAVAALLHDAVEDCGGLPVLEKIRAAFGETVAHIVDGCTDAYETPKPPWHDRKRAFIERLESASDAVLRVSNADKLHNATTLLRDYEFVGEALWARFTPTREQTLWYYRSLAELYLRRRPQKMLASELAGVFDALESVIEQGSDFSPKNFPKNAP